MNPCDRCSWNKMVNQKQLTVIFHIDDLMMAHLHSSVVTEHVKLLDEVYGSQDPLTVSRGKIHVRLGMTIYFSLKVGASFYQYDFISKMWNEMPMELKGKHRRTPAHEDLFKVDLNSESLDNNKKNTCHHVTAKCLWLSQRTRSDLQLSTGFHFTRIKSTTFEYWLKFKHALGYLRSTSFLPMTIAIDKEGNCMVCEDGSHATQTQMVKDFRVYLLRWEKVQ